MSKKVILLIWLAVFWFLPLTFTPLARASFDTIIDVSNYPGATHTEQIQAALNDVPPSGATVVVPNGVWQVSSLSGVSNVLFTGRNGTILQLTASTPVISFVGQHNFLVQNFTILGSNITGGSAVRVTGNSYNFTIRNNSFRDVDRTAVNIELSSIGQQVFDFAVDDNTFIDCYNSTIRVFGIPGRRDITDFQIARNRITSALSNGKIGIAFAAEGVIAYNMISNTEYGIATRSVSSIVIMGNIITNVTERGIYLGTNIGDPGSDNVTIRENTIVNSRIGLSKWYGSQIYAGILVESNIIENSTVLDIQADFPASFVNNTITSRTKLEIIEPSTRFKGTKDILGQPILPSDLNNDRKVDVRDIAMIARAYGTVEGNQLWNPAADIISDGKIDIKDLSFAAISYGEMA